MPTDAELAVHSFDLALEELIATTAADDSSITHVPTVEDMKDLRKGILRLTSLERRYKKNRKRARKNSNKVEKRRLVDLIPHPSQEEFFPDLSEEQLEELIEEIKDQGVTNFIEILPDNTIISGHQRVRALVSLGFDIIDVCVWHSLVRKRKKRTKRLAKMHYLKSNEKKKHSSGLRLARARLHYRLLKQGQGSGWYQQQIPWFKQTTFDEMDDLFHLGRSYTALAPKWRLICASVIVLEAYENEEITLKLAGEVARWSSERVERITVNREPGETMRGLVEHAIEKGWRKLLPELY